MCPPGGTLRLEETAEMSLCSRVVNIGTCGKETFVIRFRFLQKEVASQTQTRFSNSMLLFFRWGLRFWLADACFVFS